MPGQSAAVLPQDGVSISASDETSIDVGVLSFQTYTAATQQALTQYNVHSVSPSYDINTNHLMSLLQLYSDLCQQILDKGNL